MTAAELESYYGLKARLRLGDRETEVLVITSSRGWPVATDDGVARKQFATHNPFIGISGTIGVLCKMVEAQDISRQDAQHLYRS